MTIFTLYLRRSIFITASVVSLHSAASSTRTTPSASAPVVEMLTLEDAIQRALAKNYLIRTSAFDVSVAHARVQEQMGIFDPKLTGSYHYSKSENPALADPANLANALIPGSVSRGESYTLGLGGLLPTGLSYSLNARTVNNRDTLALPGPNYASFAGITGTQPLLRDAGFGAATASIRIAMTTRAISEWEFRRAVIDNVTRVIFAYYDLAFAQARLRSALSSHELASQLVKENTKRFEIGSMSEFDVTSAKARLASREDGILQARQFITDRENALKALISDDRTARLLEWRIEIQAPTLLPVALVDPAIDFITALQKRPDYQQALLAVKRSDIHRRSQRNQLLPRVDLVGSYGYNGYDSLRAESRRSVQDREHTVFSYGVQVSVPVLSLAERGRARVAKLQQQQAETYLASLEQDMVVQIGSTAGQIETARKRVEATRTARELGQKTLEAEIKRLRTSNGSTFLVIQQQEILSGLEIAADAALNDYQKALAEYDRQLGMTLERLNLSIVVPK